MRGRSAVNSAGSGEKRRCESERGRPAGRSKPGLDCLWKRNRVGSPFIKHRTAPGQLRLYPDLFSAPFLGWKPRIGQQNVHENREPTQRHRLDECFPAPSLHSIPLNRLQPAQKNCSSQTPESSIQRPPEIYPQHPHHPYPASRPYNLTKDYISADQH